MDLKTFFKEYNYLHISSLIPYSSRTIAIINTPEGEISQIINGHTDYILKCIEQDLENATKEFIELLKKDSQLEPCVEALEKESEGGVFEEALLKCGNKVNLFGREYYIESVEIFNEDYDNGIRYTLFDGINSFSYTEEELMSKICTSNLSRNTNALTYKDFDEIIEQVYYEQFEVGDKVRVKNLHREDEDGTVIYTGDVIKVAIKGELREVPHDSLVLEVRGFNLTNELAASLGYSKIYVNNPVKMSVVPFSNNNTEVWLENKYLSGFIRNNFDDFSKTFMTF